MKLRFVISTIFWVFEGVYVCTKISTREERVDVKIWPQAGGLDLKQAKNSIKWRNPSALTPLNGYNPQKHGSTLEFMLLPFKAASKLATQCYVNWEIVWTKVEKFGAEPVRREVSTQERREWCENMATGWWIWTSCFSPPNQPVTMLGVLYWS